MIRLVFIMLAVALVAWIAMQVVRGLRGANIDWTGLSFMAGFVVLAFWLRHITGLG